MVAWIIWYYFDALAASPNVQNMLLIRPATIFSLLLYALILQRSVSIERVGQPEAVEPAPARDRKGLRAPIVAALLVLYVAALPWIGFDVATFLFVALAMAAAGERRPWFLVAFPAVFAAALALAFRFALSVPVPTLLV
jgi:putative tricarboxylic transport membrane protein